MKKTIFCCENTGVETPEYRRPTAPPHPMPNIETIHRELHDAAHRGIRTPEEFQTKYMGKWNASAVPATLRPCTVDGEPALFHRFVDQDKGVLQINGLCKPSHLATILKNFNENNFTDSTCTIEKFRQTMALIEWPDGRLSTVAVERVQFTDRSEKNPLEDVRTSEPVMGRRW